MMFALGMGSAVALQSSIIVNLIQGMKAWNYRVEFWKVSSVCCILGCLFGLVYTTPGGQWILALIDHFAANFVIFALMILQVVGIMWVYGVENFCWDIEFMLKRKITAYWRILWFIVTPMTLIIVFVYSMVEFENPTYMSKQFPTLYIVTGWILFLFGMMQVLIWPVWSLFTRSDEDKEVPAIQYLFKTNPAWGPKLPETRNEWILFKAKKLEARKAKSIGHSRIKKIHWMLLRKYD